MIPLVLFHHTEYKSLLMFLNLSLCRHRLVWSFQYVQDTGKFVEAASTCQDYFCAWDISLTLLPPRSNSPARASISSTSVIFSRDKWQLRRWLEISLQHSRRNTVSWSPLLGPHLVFNTTENEQISVFDIVLLDHRSVTMLFWLVMHTKRLLNMFDRHTSVCSTILNETLLLSQ